ncbi:hypothetical protein FA95DRAFT_144311 [Auriscalpium vulgare]|uniref:Uncharacterized protein n=1 Tax=Auriscalpium vulgare TaxID=40419 RepID=A0ACB8S5V0_9AGAM|nr:hypothetical protein FA95DRAFT_144311 [Auriscalpium vulgare]
MANSSSSSSIPSNNASSPISVPKSELGLRVAPLQDKAVAAPMTIPHRVPAATKPVPPPASQPRKRNSSALQAVVYPPKESCSNLPIMIPNMPESGTKSRVETQVRLTVDLAHASSSTVEGLQYDRVGSWKWLQLPKGTATKKRTRKEGKIEPLLEDTLQLSVEVTCASPPHARAVCCTSCQAREAKRVARKLAQRVRPERHEAELQETGNGMTDGAFNIVQFNCAEILDFSAGSAIFPLRITCYCRHHRERVGFKVHFTMSDHTGRLVGSGTTHPIMITDDHKSTGASASRLNAGDVDWSQMSSQGEAMGKGPSGKRKQTHTTEPSEQSKKRARSSKVVRKSSSGSLDSPSVFTSALPTRTTTPSQFFNSGPPSHFSATAPSSPRISDNFIIQNAETFLPSPTASVTSPSRSDPHLVDSPEVVRPRQPANDARSVTAFETAASPANFLPTAPPSPVNNPRPHALCDPVPTFPLMFFPPAPALPVLSTPKIHRLIPSSGPTFGGIEVTVLGANFHPSLQLECVFGELAASSTQRWSDNTLVCILPPRVTSGVVAVWFNGIQKEEDGTPPCLFTYTDESDRALMELALQVVGLKMTGKLEDAKSVAMRIVGPSGDETQGGMQHGSLMNSFGVSAHDVRSMLHHVGADEELQRMVLDLLSLMDVPGTPSGTSLAAAISHPTHSGQTLLHIAVFLKFPLLVKFLVDHAVDVDARDRNGYTALHFAALVDAEECAGILLAAGADQEIVDANGKTAQELASFNLDVLSVGDAEADVDEEEESRWGDAEEESEDGLVVRTRIARRRTPRRGVDTPASVPSEDEDDLDSLHLSDKPRKEKADAPDVVVDEKAAATFMHAIQRTLARVQPTQGIIPNIPHLMPHLPNLPGMPAVPWGALPQLPMVFPVYVAWPAFLGDKRGDRGGLGPRQPKGTMRALLTPQEWRAFWEKWLSQGTGPADDPPPMYTPREKAQAREEAQARGESENVAAPPDPEEDESLVAGPSTLPSDRVPPRRVGYDSSPIPDQEVNSYAYRPATNQPRQIQKKEDRMLLLFWIPILLLALLWASLHGMRLALHSVRTMAPLKAILRI